MVKQNAESVPVKAGQEENGAGASRTASASLVRRARQALAHRADIGELQVGEFMTVAPPTIGDDQPLTDGYRLLRELDLRHLPVLHGGKLVGLLSPRSGRSLGAVEDVDGECTPVSEAMSPDAYAVGVHDMLRDVTAEMAEHHHELAVVLEHGRVIGIFTTENALGALSQLLASQPPGQ